MEKRPSLIDRLGRGALSPWATAAAVGLGVITGLVLPATAGALKGVGEVFVALLQMCAVPLVVCGVVSSIGRVFVAGDYRRSVGRVLLAMGIGLLLTSVLAVVLGLVGRPGSGLGSEASRTLGRLLSASEIQTGADLPSRQLPLVEFLIGAVPRNIFFALSQGHQLSILIFCILLGIAFGLSLTAKTRCTLDCFEATFDALLKLIEWLLYALPLGLFALIAHQVAQAGVGMFVAMLKLIVLINLGVLVSLLVGNLIIARRTGLAYGRVCAALGEPLLIAFAAKSSFAAIPATLRALQAQLRLEKHATELVLPLSVCVNPLGNVYYYVIGTIFIAQLYGVALPPVSCGFLVAGGVLAAVAGSALPSAAAIGVFAILLEPLGLPLGAAVILIMAVDPFIDPMVTVLNVHGGCVVTSLVADPQAGRAAAGAAPEAGASLPS
jgi:Na+/H+-dicarboxylate symporter